MAPNGSGSAEIHGFRGSAPWNAVIAVTGGERFGLPPGLALINAEGYAHPTSPPTVHAGSENLDVLEDAAKAGTPVRVVSHWNKTPTEVFNTTATLVGRRPELEPLMVMTPRSGWWRCASERGGGIAVWLEMMRALAEAKVDRTVHFVASTDAGIPGVKHDDLARALEAFARFAGLSPLETLRAATSEAAGALGLGAETGVLAPGFAADVVLVEGNPIEDLAVLRAPLLVVARGRVFEIAPEVGREGPTG